VTSKIKVLSLNVFGEDQANAATRIKNLVSLLQQADADVIAFQEVKQWFVLALQQDQFINKTYSFTDYGNGHVPGGLLFLSKTQLIGVSYYELVHPGETLVDQRGRLLVVQTSVKGNIVTFGNTCLDWRGATSRVGALDFIFSVLAPHSEVFLLGDFNADDGAQPEESRLDTRFIDVWRFVHKDRDKERGNTWDPNTNDYARASDPRSLGSRIDRMFLRSNHWMPSTMQLVGCPDGDWFCKKLNYVKTPTSYSANPAAFISNHYGLFAEVSRLDPYC